MRGVHMVSKRGLLQRTAWGTAWLVGGGVLLWPVMDGMVFPFVFGEMVTQGGKGNAALGTEAEAVEKKLKEYTGKKEGALIIVTGDEKCVTSIGNDLHAKRKGLLLNMSACNDPRVMLQSFLSDILWSPVIAYIKATNIFADIVTGNTNHHHTSFIFYSNFLDHMRKGFARQARDPSVPRPLLVISNVGRAVSPTEGSLQDLYLRKNMAQLAQVAEGLRKGGHADVLVTSHIHPSVLWTEDADAVTWVPYEDYSNGDISKRYQLEQYPEDLTKATVDVLQEKGWLSVHALASQCHPGHLPKVSPFIQTLVQHSALCLVEGSNLTNPNPSCPAGAHYYVPGPAAAAYFGTL
eukprot:TRINITY_DN3801_c0_g2_i1.p1 TRINITY_DN3801_c0_g2~~TRINITY_DN3801_c0_g2_i1.p1  ORF type:complete len:350 (+),score=68.69 TRINITY_DN3801_c0_g2_i1:64-1113(+)